MKFPISPHPYQHLLLSDFLILAILVSIKWYLIVVWVCISLMTNDAEHFFMSLLVICIFFLEKCLLRSFTHVKIICLLLSCQNFLYFLDTSPLLKTVKNLPAMRETLTWSLSQEDSQEKGVATHSSILAWKIPCTEEPDGLVHGVKKSRTRLND